MNLVRSVEAEIGADYSRQILYVFDKELNMLNKTAIGINMDVDMMFLMGTSGLSAR